MGVSAGGAERSNDYVRIIHKDQDVIGAFCVNSVLYTLLFTGAVYLKKNTKINDGWISDD